MVLLLHFTKLDENAFFNVRLASFTKAAVGCEEPITWPVVNHVVAYSKHGFRGCLLELFLGFSSVVLIDLKLSSESACVFLNVLVYKFTSFLLFFGWIGVHSPTSFWVVHFQVSFGLKHARIL